MSHLYTMHNRLCECVCVLYAAVEEQLVAGNRVISIGNGRVNVCCYFGNCLVH